MRLYTKKRRYYCGIDLHARCAPEWCVVPGCASNSPARTSAWAQRHRTACTESTISTELEPSCNSVYCVDSVGRGQRLAFPGQVVSGNELLNSLEYKGIILPTVILGDMP